MDNKNSAAAAPRENKMGVLPVDKLLANMAVPMMISMLFQAFYNVVDSIFVSQISENALTAVSLAFPLQNLLIAFGAGSAVGMNALLSRSLGEKNQVAADEAANTGIFIAICNSVLFALIGIFVTRPFFMIQTETEEILTHGIAYSSVCLICSAGIFFQFCFERLLQSTGRTSYAMITQIIGAVTNIILDPIFIFVLDLEVLGAAIATVIGQFVAAIAALIMNLKLNPDIHIKLKEIRPNPRSFKEIYRIGFPSIIMQSSGSIMTFGMNTILGAFTVTANAVFGAYVKLQSFIFMPIFGLNNGMIPIISYNFGAKKMDRVKKTVKLSITIAVSIMLVGVAMFELAPHVLLSMFNASDDMLKIGVVALRIIGTHYLLAGFCIIAGSVCQAIGNPVYSLIVSVCRQLVVLLPAAWILSRFGILDLVWLAFPIAEIFSLILSAIFLAKTLKKAAKITSLN